MSEKTLKFDNTIVNIKEFHKSRQPIDLISLNTEHIVTSDEFKHSNNGFKYFTGYKEGELLNCYVLSYIKLEDT